MEKLYVYHGSISSLSSSGKSKNKIDIILYNHNNENQAPTKLEVLGGLSKYIYDIEMTDAEERYLNANYYFDSNLLLHRIEIPSNDKNFPAKIITSDFVHTFSQNDFLYEKAVIFGPDKYIQTNNPEPMTRQQRHAWYEYQSKY